MVLIVFEGGEGCGKTTQMNMLHGWLTPRAGTSVCTTREPGGTVLSEKIRSIFKENYPTGEHPLPLSEPYLVTAARAQHLELILKPGLIKKDIILCDRFLDSTYVYQGYIGGLTRETINSVSLPVVQDFVPDITFVFDLEPGLAQCRPRNRPADPHLDRMDSKDMSFHTRLREGFRKLVLENVPYPSGRVPRRVLVDASGTPEEIQEKIRQTLKDLLRMN